MGSPLYTALTSGRRRLPVSAPFHCALMKPAADRLAEALAGVEFRTPEIPVIDNVDVAAETDPARIRDALFRQAYCPVRWIETVQAIAARGVDRIAECGPGKVLAGLVKRCDAGVEAVALNDGAAFEQFLQLTRGQA